MLDEVSHVSSSDLGNEPPTTVSWAPRRMALGSKFDIAAEYLCSRSAIMAVRDQPGNVKSLDAATAMVEESDVGLRQL